VHLLLLQVVFTQDWHPPNHISFAPTHSKQPQDSLQLSYTCVNHIWAGKGGPRLCNMTHLYPDPQNSVTCANHPDGSDSDGGSAGSSSKAVSQHSVAAATAAAAALAERIRSFGCPEPVTQVQQVLWPPHCMRHSAGARLHPDLIVLPEDLIVRKGWQPMIDAYSAFEDNGHLQSTGLAEQLRREGVRRVVVTGVALDFCVMWTALDAVAAGFETVLVLDGVLPVSAAGGADAVRRLRAAGVEVLQHARSLHVPAAAAGSHVDVQ
jgi:nicotinamidase-related amidase